MQRHQGADVEQPGGRAVDESSVMGERLVHGDLIDGLGSPREKPLDLFEVGRDVGPSGVSVLVERQDAIVPDSPANPVNVHAEPDGPIGPGRESPQGLDEGFVVDGFPARCHESQQRKLLRGERDQCAPALHVTVQDVDDDGQTLGICGGADGPEAFHEAAQPPRPAGFQEQPVQRFIRRTVD